MLRPTSSTLAVVVNSYNRRALLQRALDSLFAHLAPLPVEIVVIDDGSSDGSAELVEQYCVDGSHPGLRLVRPAERVLFAGGVNLGIHSTSAPYVCLFETDNVALDAGMWHGVSYLQSNPHVGAVGFRVTKIDGRQAGNSQRFPRPLAFVLGQQLSQRLGLENPSAGRRRDVVYTSPLVLSRAAMDRVGLMDAERFPFCDSDVDWCRRFAEAGYEIHVLEDVAVVHDQGGAPSEFSRRRTLDFHRARMAYFRRYHPRTAPWVRLGTLARHAVEITILGVARILGRAKRERLEARLDLVARWSRDYRD